MARNKNVGSGTKVARGKSGDSGVKKRKQARPQKPLNRARKRKIVRWNRKFTLQICSTNV